MCYGVEVSQDDSGDWTIGLYVNDQSTMGPLYTNVPNQYGESWQPSASSPNTNAYQQYIQRGYSTIENLAVNLIVGEETGNNNALVALMNIPMQAQTSVVDSFASILSQLFPFLILLIFIPPVYNTTYLMVQEKQTRIKESMRMMGMSDVPYWLSWFVWFLFVETVLVTLAFVIIVWNCISYSQPFYVWLYMWLYGIGVFGQIVFIQSFFGEAKYSGLVGSVIYFGCNLLVITVQSSTASYTLKVVMSIFPQVAMNEISVVFGTLEGNGIGI
jgi:hypothetical protein